MEIVRQLEAEGQFPQAHYAFDNGVLTLELTRLIESRGKHWVSEVEVSRHIQWLGHWRRVDEVGAELRHHHPESFRPVKVNCRNGEEKVFFAFTKVVRLKRGVSKSWGRGLRSMTRGDILLGDQAKKRTPLCHA